MPTVVLFRGMAATGKTAISTEFARQSGLCLVRKDDIYDATAAVVDEHSKRNSISELAIRNLISSNIKAGLSVVVDNSLAHFEQAHKFKIWVEAQGATLRSFHVICSDESLWKSRLESRKKNPSPNQLITDFDLLKAHYQNADTRLLADETRLDSVLPVVQLIAKIQGTFKTN